MRVVLVAVLALSMPAHAERMCFSGPMSPQVLAGARKDIAGSGGAVVASGDKFPDWRFRDLNRTVRPDVVTIAPGLAIYHPPPLAGIDVVLEDADHNAVARMQRALTIEDRPPAPIVQAVTASVVSQDRRAALAELTGKIPEHAIVLVMSRIAGSQVVPLTWTPVREGQPGSVLVWHTPYSCEATIPSAIEPRIGERVVLTWVDDAGRISEPSKSIVIAGASKGK